MSGTVTRTVMRCAKVVRGQHLLGRKEPSYIATLTNGSRTVELRSTLPDAFVVGRDYEVSETLVVVGWAPVVAKAA